MKDTPLLMKPEMVNATLERLKTHTRRTQGLDEINYEGFAPTSGYWKYRGVEPDGIHHLFGYADGITDKVIKCPYGGIGDRLWVRETWKPTGMFATMPNLRTRACSRFAYRADSEQLKRDERIKWRPSIFMPRFASRINLEIVDITAERIQDISAMDAISEGIKRSKAPTVASRVICEINEFHVLWDSINDKRGYGWQTVNPYVWVIVFKMI